MTARSSQQRGPDMITEAKSHTGATITQMDRRGTWTIGDRLGIGNEGEVYAIESDPARAAKIYHEDKRPGPVQTSKLHAMEGKPPQEPPRPRASRP